MYSTCIHYTLIPALSQSGLVWCPQEYWCCNIPCQTGQYYQLFVHPSIVVVRCPSLLNYYNEYVYNSQQSLHQWPEGRSHVIHIIVDVPTKKLLILHGHHNNQDNSIVTPQKLSTICIQPEHLPMFEFYSVNTFMVTDRILPTSRVL